MKWFDYSFLKSIKVPSSFLTVTNGIYALKSKEEQKQLSFPDIFTKLEHIAVIQSVKSSNAIEGIITTDKRIEEIVSKNSAPLNHSEQEIAGYRDALNLIHTNFKDIAFDETTVLNLHKVLLSHTELSEVGQYKSQENVIRERYLDGTSSIRWTPVSANDTPFSMQQMFLSYMDARDDAGINQLLLIPCVILDFLCIHPFQDGNGRISRLLTLLLLYKNGFDICKYISFEEQTNKCENLYYEALKLSSVGWHDNENDYLPFIENFIYTLYLCYKELDKRFLTLNSGKVSKEKRVEQTVLNAFIPITKKEICELLIDVSPTTVEAVLSTMLKQGKIKKIGTTRNSKYIKN